MKSSSVAGILPKIKSCIEAVKDTCHSFVHGGFNSEDNIQQSPVPHHPFQIVASQTETLNLVAIIIAHIYTNQAPGAILVFLPGSVRMISPILLAS